MRDTSEKRWKRFMRVESRFCGNLKKPLGRFRRRGLVSQGSFPLALGPGLQVCKVERKSQRDFLSCGPHSSKLL